MTKEELIEKVCAEHAGFTLREVRLLVNETLRQIREQVLIEGHEARLQGFGRFYGRKTRTSGMRGDGSRWAREPGTALAFQPYTKTGGRGVHRDQLALTTAPATKGEPELHPRVVGVPSRYSSPIVA